MSQAEGEVAATTLAVIWNGDSVNGGSAPGRQAASAAPGTLLEEPFAALGSTRPELDAALVAHAVFGRLAELLWQGAHADRAEVDHLVDFCLGAVSRRTLSSCSTASVSRPAARMCARARGAHAVPLRVVAHHQHLAEVVVVDRRATARRRRARRSCTPRRVRAPRSRARRGAARSDDRLDGQLGERAPSSPRIACHAARCSSVVAATASQPSAASTKQWSGSSPT